MFYKAGLETLGEAEELSDSNMLKAFALEAVLAKGIFDL